jgi:acetate kinase
LRWLGPQLSLAANNQGLETISAPDSHAAIRVIPTDEEAVIAKHTAKLMFG